MIAALVFASGCGELLGVDNVVAVDSTAVALERRSREVAMDPRS